MFFAGVIFLSHSFKPPDIKYMIVGLTIRSIWICKSAIITNFLVCKLSERRITRLGITRDDCALNLNNFSSTTHSLSKEMNHQVFWFWFLYSRVHVNRKIICLEGVPRMTCKIRIKLLFLYQYTWWWRHYFYSILDDVTRIFPFNKNWNQWYTTWGTRTTRICQIRLRQIECEHFSSTLKKKGLKALFLNWPKFTYIFIFIRIF